MSLTVDKYQISWPLNSGPLNSGYVTKVSIYALKIRKKKKKKCCSIIFIHKNINIRSSINFTSKFS